MKTFSLSLFFSIFPLCANAYQSPSQFEHPVNVRTDQQQQQQKNTVGIGSTITPACDTQSMTFPCVVTGEDAKDSITAMLLNNPDGMELINKKLISSTEIAGSRMVIKQQNDSLTKIEYQLVVATMGPGSGVKYYFWTANISDNGGDAPQIFENKISKLDGSCTAIKDKNALIECAVQNTKNL